MGVLSMGFEHCHRETRNIFSVVNPCKVHCQLITVSVIGLEFFSSLEFGFPGALHLQSTV